MSSSIRRYATLISACASMATAGSLFSFSVLSGGLQTQLGYTSANLNTISGVGNSSIYVSFLFIGPLFDYLGAQLTILCGFLTFTLGYFLMYLAYIGSIDSSTGAMSLYYFIVGIGSTCAYMGAIGGNVLNFSPTSSGKVVGLLLLFYGLSGTIYSQVYFGLYLGTTSGYLLFLTLSVGVVNLACCFMTFKVPFDKDGKIGLEETRAVASTSDGEDVNKVVSESQKATTLSPCTTMKRNSTLKEAFASTSSVGYSKPLSGARSNSQHSISSIPELIMQANTLKSESKSRLSLKASKLSVHKVDKGKPFPKLAKLATPLGKSALGQASVTREASEDSLDASLDTVNLDAASQQLTILSDPIIQEEAKGVDHDELDSASLKPLEILKSPTFWLYALTYITGQGLTYMSNFLSILMAAEGQATVMADPNAVSLRNTTHVTLISIFQSLGRVTFSLALDAIENSPRIKTDRSALLVVSNLFVFFPTVILAAGANSEGALYFCSIFTGYGFGGAGACFPALTKDFFGMHFYGTACGFVMAGVPIGILASNQVFGLLYDRNSPGATVCYGSACYSTAFVVLTVFQCVALLSSGILMATRSGWRIKREK